MCFFQVKYVLRDNILACKHINPGIANDYKQLVEELLEWGFIIQGVTIDGTRGAVSGTPKYIIGTYAHYAWGVAFNQSVS